MYGLKSPNSSWCKEAFCSGDCWMCVCLRFATFQNPATTFSAHSSCCLWQFPHHYHIRRAQIAPRIWYPEAREWMPAEMERGSRGCRCLETQTVCFQWNNTNIPRSFLVYCFPSQNNPVPVQTDEGPLCSAELYYRRQSKKHLSIFSHYTMQKQ